MARGTISTPHTPRWMVIALGVSVGTARAQDPAPATEEPNAEVGEASGDEEGAASEEADPAVPEPVVPWSSDSRWRPIGLFEPARTVAVTVEGTEIVLTLDGRLLRRAGAERVWEELRGGSTSRTDEEDLLLDVEMAADELGAVDQSDDVSQNDADETVSEVSEEVDSSQAILDREQESEYLPGLGVDLLWASIQDPGVVLLVEGGDLFRSMDDGVTFSPTFPVPAPVDIDEAAGDSVLVAATADGVRHSYDRGRSWIREAPRGAGRPALSVALEGEDVWAGTPGGVAFWQRGSESWRTGFDVPGPVEVLDAAGGSVWAIAQGDLYVRPAEGEQWRRATSAPPSVDLVALGPGHVLTAGPRGVWESVDAGRTFLPVQNGLVVSNPRRVIIGPRGPVAAGGFGVGRLERWVANVEAAILDDDVPPIEAIVNRSLRRPGLDISPLELQKGVFWALAAPRLRLTGRLWDTKTRRTDFQSLNTRELQGDLWWVEAQVCWGGGSCGDYDDILVGSDVGFTDEAGFIDDIVIVGGEIYDADDVTSISPAAANVTGRIASYRTDLAALLTNLYYSRRALVGETPVIATRPLTEQVGHAIDLAEIDARLDLYSDGMFSSPNPTEDES